MVMVSDRNFFGGFAANVSVGLEDFLTGSLATLMTRIPELQLQFLKWVGEGVETLIPLHEMEWKIQGQDKHRTKAHGGAIIDMVFSNENYELWFEHKLGASEGKTTNERGKEIGQLKKYLTAATEYRGVKGKGKGKQVLLFFITAKYERVVREQVEPVHCLENCTGFVWKGKHGGLRWKDFHAQLLSVMYELQNKYRADNFDTRLLFEFVEWWERDSRLMPLKIGAGGFSVKRKKGEDSSSEWENRIGVVEEICDWVNRYISHDPSKSANTHSGDEDAVGQYTVIFETGREDMPYLRAEPVVDLNKIPDWKPGEMGSDVLSFQFRVISKKDLSGLPRFVMIEELGLPARLTIEDGELKATSGMKYSGTVKMTFYINVNDWHKLKPKPSRERNERVRRITEGVCFEFSKITGIDLTALEEQPDVGAKERELYKENV